MMSIFLCFVFPLFVVLFKKLLPSKGKLPPGPRGLPIIGNLHQLDRLLHSSFHKLSLEYGPVTYLRFGVVPMVVFSSKEAAKEVLKTHDLETCNRPKLVANGLFTHDFKGIGLNQYGEEWREMKKLMGLEVLSPKRQKSFRYIREEEGDLLVKKMSNFAQTQTSVDLRKALFSFTAGILFRIAFGQNFHECEFIDMDRLDELMLELETNVFYDLVFTDFLPTGLGWLVDRISGQHVRVNKTFSKLTIFFQKVIDEHLKVGQPQEHSDLVSAMLYMIKEPSTDSFKITSDHLQAMMSDVVMAGVNAGVTTMVWMMTELIRHPKVMKKLQEEIRSTLGPDKERITEEDLEKVEYFKLVINETFRLHPPAPLLLPRQSMADIKIQGYHIPKNAMVKINTYTIGRDPKCWTNPEEFIPERFYNSPINYKGQHFELLPFGAGRRSCPGMALGMTMIELGLLNILYFFDWNLPNGMTTEDIDMEEIGALSIAKKIPLELVPTLRSSLVSK